MYEHSGINYLWSVKNYLDVLDKLRAVDGPFDSVDVLIFLLFTLHFHTILQHKSDFKRGSTSSFLRKSC